LGFLSSPPYFTMTHLASCLTDSVDSDSTPLHVFHPAYFFTSLYLGVSEYLAKQGPIDLAPHVWFSHSIHFLCFIVYRFSLLRYCAIQEDQDHYSRYFLDTELVIRFVLPFNQFLIFLIKSKVGLTICLLYATVQCKRTKTIIA